MEDKNYKLAKAFISGLTYIIRYNKRPAPAKTVRNSKESKRTTANAKWQRLTVVIHVIQEDNENNPEDDLLKSKFAQIGDIHVWKDKKQHRKTPNGWVEVATQRVKQPTVEY